MKRSVLLTLGALAMTIVAAASASGAGNAAAASTAKSVTLHKGDLYVSVGSSLASGFGIAPQSQCGRSGRDYGHLVAAKLKLKLVDVSCGSAVIPNVLNTPQGTAPPQIESVTSNTKLITVGLGGNDIEYNGTAFACSNPTATCQAPANLAALEAALPGEIDAMIAALKAKAPSATIVVVTYPREFPATGNCPALGLTNADVSLLRGMGAFVESSLVAAAHKTHVLLVDPYSQPGDHTACGPAGERWTNGSKVATGAGFAYHPTALGHQQMAKMILKVLGH